MKLEAKSKLSDPEWLLVSQYSLSDASFSATNTCHVYVPNPYAVLLEGMDPASAIFNWVIEMEDPRVMVTGLINDLLHFGP